MIKLIERFIIKIKIIINNHFIVKIKFVMIKAKIII